jgi:Rod binding domain-containing protein
MAADAMNHPDADMRKEAVHELAREFEAILVSTLLKESLKNASKIEDDEDESGGNTYMEMAYDQIAHHVGRQGILGLADQITGAKGTHDDSGKE